MLEATKTRTLSRDERERNAAVADAWRAANMAATIARVSAAWSARADLAEDDAADAVRAAQRARIAAEHAEHARTVPETVAQARAAWAAAMSAAEADQRVVAAIAEALVAA